ncbi:MAG TPA: hypothetical protein VJ483_05135 [Holophagaceae bacterium]|nr:hypothetical protein [Holophagaceae bacterium]
MGRAAIRLGCVLALGLAAPLAAQSYGEGTPYGGSKVFSEGLDPMGNPAHFDLLPGGIYLGFEAGDLKPWSTVDADRLFRDAFAASDAGAQDRALDHLAAKPWAQRRRAFGLQWALEGGLRLGYGHGDLRGGRAQVDLVHTGAALPQNGTVVEAARFGVDRLMAGVGSQAGPWGTGFSARLERVRFGQEVLALHPAAGQAPLADPTEALEGGTEDQKAWAFSMDFGLTRELNDWIRAGLTLDRILPRSFGPVRERTQARLGLQLDLAPLVQLALEGDLNAAARMPLPQKQRVLAASLRVEGLVKVVSFTLGAERRSLEGTHSTLVGAAVHVRSAPLLWSFGFQLGDDRPLLGGAFRLGR